MSTLSKKKLAIAATVAALLTACGGGGGTTSVSNVDNKWASNAGTYYSCDSHTKQTATLTPNGTNQLAISLKQEVFSLDACTGTVIGTVSTMSMTMTYINTIAATVTGVGTRTSLQNLSIDTVTVTAPAQNLTLTGSGVTGNCVNYLNGNTCFNSLSIPSVLMNAGIYLSSTAFATLVQNGSAWVADQPNLTKQ